MILPEKHFVYQRISLRTNRFMVSICSLRPPKINGHLLKDNRDVLSESVKATPLSLITGRVFSVLHVTRVVETHWDYVSSTGVTASINQPAAHYSPRQFWLATTTWCTADSETRRALQYVHLIRPLCFFDIFSVSI